MPRILPPLTWLRAFEAAARHRSFVSASAELGVTPSAVSQQVRLLEQHLGRLLFHRLPRGLRLAEAGESYLPLLSEAFERVSAGTVEIFGERKTHRLTVRTTVAFSVLWLAPRLPRFRALHPDVEFRVTSSIWPAEFPDPGIDLEIRQGTGDWPGLEAERLTQDHIFPVCSPALAAGSPGLTEPADLARHTLLHAIGFRDGWGQWLQAAGLANLVDAHRGLEFDTGVMTIEMALRGAGVALGRTCFTEELLADGRLVAPFSITVTTNEAFFVVAQSRSRVTEASRSFRKWLRAEASSTAAYA